MCLIPEVTFSLDKLLEYVGEVLEKKGNAVVCVAEGAGQVRPGCAVLLLICSLFCVASYGHHDPEGFSAGLGLSWTVVVVVLGQPNALSACWHDVCLDRWLTYAPRDGARLSPDLHVLVC